MGWPNRNRTIVETTYFLKAEKSRPPSVRRWPQVKQPVLISASSHTQLEAVLEDYTFYTTHGRQGQQKISYFFKRISLRKTRNLSDDSQDLKQESRCKMQNCSAKRKIFDFSAALAMTAALPFSAFGFYALSTIP